MNARDCEYERKYLSTFRDYDQGFNSPEFVPADLTLNRYRDFFESYFPSPILF